MYHPSMIIARERRIMRKRKMLDTFPKGFVPSYSVEESADYTARLMQIVDDHGEQTRPLTKDEEDFMAATRLRITFDFPYFAERFVWIDEEGHGLRPLYPLWESQATMLKRMGQIELDNARSHRPDGILLNVLKARQLGISTFAEALVAHRLMTRTHTRALCGADVEDQAKYLFEMVERIYNNLPWFLKPQQLVRRQGRELGFSNGSVLKSGWGKSTRGELQETTGRQKGHMARGKTFSVIHISELSTWDNPGQLDDATLQTVPISPYALVVLESTAKGAGNWWHQHWLTAQEGIGRFKNFFVPWGIEPGKYSLPAPVEWVPKETTLQQARRAEEKWPAYIGHPIVLSRDQLYFYETTRDYFQHKSRRHDGSLAKFFEEYASDPEECFIYSGASVWTLDQLEQIDRLAKPLIDVWKVEPARDIAELKREERKEPEQDRRFSPPMAPRVSGSQSAVAPETMPVPAGYGFRRIWKPGELADLPSMRDTVMGIWEYPRQRGPRRYVVSADIGDGLGKDFSVADVIRIPTIEEPAEQVAQFCSNRLTPTQFAFVIDAIGRYYCDEDGVEAQAAIECNNHGLSTQDTLQLHLGYTHFYVWEYLDAASPESRYSTKIGWVTTPRTRPILIDKFFEGISTLDPITSWPDLRVNSSVTRGELRHFVVPDEPGATLGDARAAPGQRDDAIMTGAIGYYAAYRMAGGELEPIAERRRRREALLALRKTHGLITDYRNTDVTSEEADQGVDHEYDEFRDNDGGLTFDPRSTIDIP